MIVLLPPSETKRPGGEGAPLDLARLVLPSLGEARRAVVGALVDLAADVELSRRVLKLSERQAGDVVHNRMLRSAPTMAAVDRYTGVLYDALDASGLDPKARRWLGDHVWIHSAPFGPVSALDPIPAYRLAAGTSLPGIPPLRRHWARPTTEAIAAAAPTAVLDLRSEAYAALGRVPDSIESAYVRVVTDDGGSSRALNHFNKKSKGELVRALAQDRPRVRTIAGFRSWADGRGIVVRDSADPGVLELVVSS